MSTADLSFDEIYEDYLNQHKLFSIEGRKGVCNLAQVAHDLGYRDHSHMGQFGNACLGDLLEFLQDNSGAVEAIHDWIRSNGDRASSEWRDSLVEITDLEEEEEEEEEE